MRWKTPSNSATRTRNKFLWFPKKIESDVRWLERAKWVEEYNGSFWFPQYWVD